MAVYQIINVYSNKSLSIEGTRFQVLTANQKVCSKVYDSQEQVKTSPPLLRGFENKI